MRQAGDVRTLRCARGSLTGFTIVCPRRIVVMARMWWSACCLKSETGTPLPSIFLAQPGIIDIFGWRQWQHFWLETMTKAVGHSPSEVYFTLSANIWRVLLTWSISSAAVGRCFTYPPAAVYEINMDFPLMPFYTTPEGRPVLDSVLCEKSPKSI